MLINKQIHHNPTRRYLPPGDGRDAVIQNHSAPTPELKLKKNSKSSNHDGEFCLKVRQSRLSASGSLRHSSWGSEIKERSRFDRYAPFVQTNKSDLLPAEAHRDAQVFFTSVKVSLKQKVSTHLKKRENPISCLGAREQLASDSNGALACQEAE